MEGETKRHGRPSLITFGLLSYPFNSSVHLQSRSSQLAKSLMACSNENLVSSRHVPCSNVMKPYLEEEKKHFNEIAYLAYKFPAVPTPHLIDQIWPANDLPSPKVLYACGCVAYY